MRYMRYRTAARRPPPEIRCGVEGSLATGGPERKRRSGVRRGNLGSSPDAHAVSHHGKNTGTRSSVASSTSPCSASPTLAKSPKRY